MSKFHIKEDGSPGKCSANPGKCPLGNELAHYSTPQDARNAFEKLMSGELWSPLFQFRFKASSWESIPWSMRKLKIENWLKSIAHREAIFLPPITWKRTLDPSGFTLGRIVWEGENFKKPEIIEFSEALEVLSEAIVKEIALHEFSHLARGNSDMDDDHDILWESKFKNLSEKYSDGPPVKVRKRTALSREELDRYRIYLSLPLTSRWRGVCSNDHILFQEFAPSKRAICVKCFFTNRRVKIVWEKWR